MSFKNIRNVILTFLVIALILIVGFAIYSTYFRQPFEQDSNNKLSVNIDKTAILQRTRDLNRLVTKEKTYDREMKLTLDLGDFKVFDVKVLENKREVSVRVVGSVFAGIDLSKMNEDNIKISEDNKKVTINTPTAEIFNVNILEDQLRIDKDKPSLLFSIANTLDRDRERELNEYLQQQVIKQTKLALTKAACDDNILSEANENGKKNIQETATIKNSTAAEIEVNLPPVGNCELKE